MCPAVVGWQRGFRERDLNVLLDPIACPPCHRNFNRDARFTNCFRACWGSDNGGIALRWRRDGKELFYLSFGLLWTRERDYSYVAV
jgi:hypothetical protein